ncbi:ABC transporter permease [Gemmatimonadota bacterium]
MKQRYLFRLYRLALIAYPKAFRDECATEMLDTVRAREKELLERGWSVKVARFWTRELVAVLRSGILMRLTARRQRQVGQRSLRRVHPGSDALFSSILQDVRFAARSFRKTPGLTCIVIVTLALGIGANAAVLPFLYGILIKPLPFEEPDRLTVLFENAPGFTRASPSFPNYVDWRDRSATFEDMGAYWRTSNTLSGYGDPERLSGCLVSFSLFDVLRVRPAHGRAFLPEDDVVGSPPTVLLSHGLWTRRFGADPDLVGQSLLLDGEPHTVIGVMPAGYRFPDQADYWIPYRRSPTASRGGGAASVIGRLNPETTFEMAQNEMSAIATQLAQDYPETNAQRGIVVRPLEDDILWGRRTPVLIFYAVTCIVLLLACANVANLLLARSMARRREMAMRTVLGASRFRIARQLLTESLLLASLGGALGLLIGSWGLSAALAMMAGSFPYYFEFDIGLPVLLAILGTALLSGLVFGMAPSIGFRSSELSDGLREGDTGRFPGRGANRIRSALVASEVGLALIVLVGAGLLTRSFLSLTAVEAGFDRENLLTVQLSLPRDRYSDVSLQHAFFRAARERIMSVAGVVSVSGVSNLPMTGSHQRTSIYAEHSPVPLQGEEEYALNRQVQPDYFDVMGIPLVSGSVFAEQGLTSSGPAVVIVDQALAAHLWPNESALGKRIKYGSADNTRWSWMEVVGVVGNTHHFSLDDSAEKGMYRPFSQEPMRTQTTVIRTAGDPLSLVDQIRREIWSIDPNLPVENVRTMDRAVRDSYWQRSAQMWLLSILSLVAILLAAFGVYGVVAYSVGQRTREFGIRMALGAEHQDIASLVVRHVAMLASIGLAAGVVVALVVMRFGSALLFDVEYTDAPTYGIAVAVMAATAIFAAYVPARRAARLDPNVALRFE